MPIKGGKWSQFLIAATHGCNSGQGESVEDTRDYMAIKGVKGTQLKILATTWL